MNAAIIEDSSASGRQLISCLQRFAEEQHEAISHTWYRCVEPFLEEYHFQFDLVFLDIELPDGNGMEAAEKLRARDSRVILIFTTRLAQYAVKGYEVDALDYMVKPIRYPAFEMKMKRAVKRWRSLQERDVMLNVGEQSVRLSAASVKYVEIYKHHIVYHTENGDYETYGVLKQAEEALPEGMFFRLGSSYIVNFRHIERVAAQSVAVDGKELPISRLRKKEFLEALHSYYMGRQ